MNGLFKKIFRKNRKKNLRELCKEKYGDDFVNMYDTINSGGTIGDLEETMIFLRLVEKAERGENGEA